MATISAADVKKLRDATGAGMMDCKKALIEAEGDYEKAVDILRVSGQAKAAKRGAERAATNGLVAYEDGALIQLGAETDFVAKNAEFQTLAADAVKAAAASKAGDVEAANAAPLPSGKTVGEAVEELAVKIGEKLEVANAAYFDGQTAAYLHRRASDLPPQVGVLVGTRARTRSHCKGCRDADRAMRPQYVSRDDVPATWRRTSAGSPRRAPRGEASQRRLCPGSSRAE
jgi:elongation factor Ts